MAGGGIEARDEQYGLRVDGGAAQAGAIATGIGVGGGGVLGPNNPQPVNSPLNSPHPALLLLLVPVGTRRTCQV